MTVAARTAQPASPRLFDASPLHEIAFWNSIQLTSQCEKSCQMAVPPSRALLFAELPVSGRARVRVKVTKLPLFGEPRTRRRFSEKYHAVSEKSLLDAGIIRRGRWAFIMFPLPKPDGALVKSEHCCKVSLRHACKGPRRAQLPTRDEVAASIGHRRPVYSSCENYSAVGALLGGITTQFSKSGWCELCSDDCRIRPESKFVAKFSGCPSRSHQALQMSPFNSSFNPSSRWTRSRHRALCFPLLSF